MIYKFKSGQSFKADVQEVGERLETLREKHDCLKTEVVVNDAKNKGSPLHPVFEWNDKKAAHQHRLNKARQMIRAIVVAESEGEEFEPAYVNIVVGDHENYYQSTRIAVGNPSEWSVVVETARKAIETAYNRLDELQKIAVKMNPDKIPMIAKAQQALLKSSNILSTVHN